MASAVVPELYVTDLSRSLRFYVGGLGFEIAYDRPEGGFAAIKLSESVLMLEEVRARTAASDDEFEAGEWRTAELEFPFGRGVSFEVTVADVEAVHARIVGLGYEVKLGVRDRTYRVGEEFTRLRQFLVMDPDGYLVRPAQRIDRDDAATA
jgi:catechol 2,3-dioxygenase-like lactoylglutathione lyase family enzyme